MDSRKARIIDALLCHLEDMDAGDLKSAMAPKADKVVELEIEPAETHLAEAEMGVEGEKGPMEALMDESGDNGMAMAEASKEEDDMDDEDLEDLEKLLG